MANEERRQQQVLQDVDPSNLGQLSPGYTPYLELQNQNRSLGRGLGRGGESRQLGKATGQPQFTELQSQDLSAVARETAVHLRQAELDSRDQVKLNNREQEAMQREPDAPTQQQEHNEKEVAKEIQQPTIQLDSTDTEKLDNREQGAAKQETIAPDQGKEPKERETTKEKEEEKDHER